MGTPHRTPPPQPMLLPLLPLLFLLACLPPSSSIPLDYWENRDMGPSQTFLPGLTLRGIPQLEDFMRKRRSQSPRPNNRTPENFQRMYRGDKPAYVNNYAQAVMRGLG